MSLSTFIWSIPDRLVSAVSKVALIWTANRRPIIVGTVIATIGAGSLVLLYITQRKIVEKSISVLPETEDVNVPEKKDDNPAISPQSGDVHESDSDSMKAIVPAPDQTIVPHAMSVQSVAVVIPTNRSRISSPSTEYYSVQDAASGITSNTTFNEGSFYTAPTDASMQSLGGITTEDEMLPEADEYDRATPEPSEDKASKAVSSFLSCDLSEEVISTTISNISDMSTDELKDNEVAVMRGYLVTLFDLVKSSSSSKAASAHHLWSRVVKWLSRITSYSPNAIRLLVDVHVSEDLMSQLIAICKDEPVEMATLIHESEVSAILRTLTALTHQHILNQIQSSMNPVSGPMATHWILLKAAMNQIWQAVLLPLDQLPVELASKSIQAQQESHMITASLGWNAGREVQLTSLQLVESLLSCISEDTTAPVTAQYRELLLSVGLPGQQKNMRCLLSLALPRAESLPSGVPESEDDHQWRVELRSTALKCLIHISHPMLPESDETAGNDGNYLAVKNKGSLMILNVKNMPSSISILLKRVLLVHPHDSENSPHQDWLYLLANLLNCVLVCIQAKRGDLLMPKDAEADRSFDGDVDKGEDSRRFRSFFSVLLNIRQDLQASAAMLVTRGESLAVRKLASDVVSLLESISSLC